MTDTSFSAFEAGSAFSMREIESAGRRIDISFPKRINCTIHAGHPGDGKALHLRSGALYNSILVCEL